jgi:hypothetical protein
VAPKVKFDVQAGEGSMMRRSRPCGRISNAAQRSELMSRQGKADDAQVAALQQNQQRGLRGQK